MESERGSRRVEVVFMVSSNKRYKRNQVKAGQNEILLRIPHSSPALPFPRNPGNPPAWGLTSFGILNVSDLMLPQVGMR